VAAMKVPVCPMCGTVYEDRPEDEPVYSCIDCGAKGFDCCIAGNGVRCADCDEIWAGE
jgi:hypothetical protein